MENLLHWSWSCSRTCHERPQGKASTCLQTALPLFNAHTCDVFAAFPGKRNLLNYSSSSLALSISPHNPSQPVPKTGRAPSTVDVGSRNLAMCVFHKFRESLSRWGSCYPHPHSPWHVTVVPQQNRNQQPPQPATFLCGTNQQPILRVVRVRKRRRCWFQILVFFFCL